MRKHFHAISPAMVLLVLAAVWAAQPAQPASEPAAFEEVAEYLNVPTSVFNGALISLQNYVSDMLTIVDHSLSVYNDDFSLANAIRDCVDLLEISTDELSWALSAIQTGKSDKTDDLGLDLNTWLSAVYTNQETCMEGLEGTKTFMGTLVANRLSKVASRDCQALGMVYIAPNPASNVAHSSSRDCGRRLLKSNKQEQSRDFPSWASAKDRRLLRASLGSVLAPDAIVALDGTGNFTSINDAVKAARDHSKDRFIVYVKKGVYHENVLIGSRKRNVMMYGDGMDATVVTGNRSVSDGWTTYGTATFGVSGPGFIARDMTFENTAGPEKRQAVAFRSTSDRSALFRCAFRGYQDTLYPHSHRQFYRECTITGTVDFIFGSAIAVFQDCLILVKKGLDHQKNTVTAHGRNCSNSTTGFSIQKCNISADVDLLQARLENSSVSTYLGRPWSNFSRTVVMETYISDIVANEGWLDWKDRKYRDTLYYAEYNNSGPGADLSNRVKWPGYHAFNSSDQAMDYTVTCFIQGDLWLPETGVRYDKGLSVH